MVMRVGCKVAVLGWCGAMMPVQFGLVATCKASCGEMGGTIDVEFYAGPK